MGTDVLVSRAAPRAGQGQLHQQNTHSLHMQPFCTPVLAASVRAAPPMQVPAPTLLHAVCARARRGYDRDPYGRDAYGRSAYGAGYAAPAAAAYPDDRVGGYADYGRGYDDR